VNFRTREEHMEQLFALLQTECLAELQEEGRKSQVSS
jgi:hypothetical protein